MRVGIGEMEKGVGWDGWSMLFGNQDHNLCYFCFFFQAEDGIRDHCVTGVQTCALPIWVLLLYEVYDGTENYMYTVTCRMLGQ